MFILYLKTPFLPRRTAEVLAWVALYTNPTVEDVHAVAQGRIWTGQAALGVGLVDELGSLDDAIRITAKMANLKERTYRLKRLPKTRDSDGSIPGAFPYQHPLLL